MMNEEQKARAIECAERRVRECQLALYEANSDLEWVRKGYELPAAPAALIVAESTETEPDGTVVHTELVEEVLNPRRRGKKKNGAPTYRQAHWGRTSGGVDSFDVADPRRGPIIALGELVTITYGTLKGDDKAITDYVHPFELKSVGPFGKGRPQLAYNRDGQLVIAGGGYVVKSHGIIG